jgi:hypothetical protein
MGHCITALIAGPEVIGHLRESHSLISVELRENWYLVPLEDEDLDGFGVDFTTTWDGFNYLSPALADFLAGLSRLGPLIFVETEYFGGVGDQAAAAFAEGHILPPTPVAGDCSINRALRCLGIISPEDLDEFDYIGLSRYRRTSDWKAAAGPLD